MDRWLLSRRPRLTAFRIGPFFVAVEQKQLNSSECRWATGDKLVKIVALEFCYHIKSFQKMTAECFFFLQSHHDCLQHGHRPLRQTLLKAGQAENQGAYLIGRDLLQHFPSLPFLSQQIKHFLTSKLAAQGPPTNPQRSYPPQPPTAKLDGSQGKRSIQHTTRAEVKFTLSTQKNL